MIMRRPKQQKRRYLGEDGMWYYCCITCNDYKPEYEYTNNREKSFGKNPYCKECVKEKKWEKQVLPTKPTKEYGTRWIAPVGRHLNLKDLTNDDKINAIEYLKQMGFDTSQIIHHQFGKRIEEKYGVILEFDDVPYYEKEDNGK